MTLIRIELPRHMLELDTESEQAILYHLRDGSFCRDLNEYEADMVYAAFMTGVGYEYDEGGKRE